MLYAAVRRASLLRRPAFHGSLSALRGEKKKKRINTFEREKML